MNKPEWWPECPYPEDIFPMKPERYSEIVPDPELRTAFGRVFWNIGNDLGAIL